MKEFKIDSKDAGSALVWYMSEVYAQNAAILDILGEMLADQRGIDVSDLRESVLRSKTSAKEEFLDELYIRYGKIDIEKIDKPPSSEDSETFEV